MTVSRCHRLFKESKGQYILVICLCLTRSFSTYKRTVDNMEQFVIFSQTNIGTSTENTFERVIHVINGFEQRSRICLIKFNTKYIIPYGVLNTI